jgi:hypothetical protein
LAAANRTNDDATKVSAASAETCRARAMGSSG